MPGWATGLSGLNFLFSFLPQSAVKVNVEAFACAFGVHHVGLDVLDANAVLRGIREGLAVVTATEDRDRDGANHRQRDHPGDDA